MVLRLHQHNIGYTVKACVQGSVTDLCTMSYVSIASRLAIWSSAVHPSSYITTLQSKARSYSHFHTTKYYFHLLFSTVIWEVTI